MVHPKYGKLHVCLECAAKFFDLQKEVAVCPVCGVKIDKTPRWTLDDYKVKPGMYEVQSRLDDFDDLDELEGDYDGEFDTELDGDFTSTGEIEGEEEDESDEF